MPYSPETKRLYDKQRYRKKNPPKTPEQKAHKLIESAKKKRIENDKRNQARKDQRALGKSLSQTFGFTMSKTPSKSELMKAMEPLTPKDIGKMLDKEMDNEREHTKTVEHSRVKEAEHFAKVGMSRHKLMAKLTTPMKAKADSDGSDTFSSEEKDPMARRAAKKAAAAAKVAKTEYSDDEEEVSDGYYTAMNEDSDEEKEHDSEKEEDEESVVEIPPKVSRRSSSRVPKAAAKKASKPAAKYPKKAAPKYAKKDPPKAAAKKDPPKSAKKDPPVDDKEMARIKGLTKIQANKELLALDTESVDATQPKYLKALGEQAKWDPVGCQIRKIKNYVKYQIGKKK